MADQHIEQPGELRGSRLDRHWNRCARKQLQAAAVTGRQAFKQGAIKAMKVIDCISHRKSRLQVQMQRRVAERCNIHQSHVAMRTMQSKGEIYRYGGGPASTFCVHYRENPAAHLLALDSSLCRAQPHKSFQQLTG